MQRTQQMSKHEQIWFWENNNTPETDAEIRNALWIYGSANIPVTLCDFARRLERERDEARAVALACHRAFSGGSDVAKKVAAEVAEILVNKVTKELTK